MLVAAADLTQYTELDLAGFEHAVNELCNPARVSSIAPAEFSGLVTQRRIEGVLFSNFWGSGQVMLERDQALIDVDPSHMVKVSLQLEGRTVVEQAGRRLAAEPGDLLVYDTAQPYLITHPGPFRIVVIQAPHSRVGVTDAITASLAPGLVTGQDGLGRIISPFLAGLGSSLERLDEPTAVQLTDNAMDLLRALLAASMDAQQLTDDPGWALSQRIYDYIDDNLGESGLTPADVARASYVSTRKLHAIFQDHGTTVNSYIRSRRLEKCYLALSDPTQLHDTVAAIGARWGFTDSSHFSRAFKQVYRETPGAVRRRALAQRTPLSDAS